MTTPNVSGQRNNFDSQGEDPFGHLANESTAKGYNTHQRQHIQQQLPNMSFPQIDPQQQFMYDPLLNTARHLGGQFAEQQKQKVNSLES